MGFAPKSTGFWKNHLVLPMGVFLVISVFMEFTSTDIRLADVIYHLSGNAWLLRDAWITRDLIHEGGRVLVGLCLIVLLVLIFSSYFSWTLKPYRKGFFYLLVSSLASALLINLLKETTHVDCPWDLARYGGSYPYLRNFDWVSTVSRHGACFPSGHASGAWAWLGAYFWAIEYKYQWRMRVVAIVLATGLIFGFSQQLRGAHFLSHDIWTLGICWFAAVSLYVVFYFLPFRPVLSRSASN